MVQLDVGAFLKGALARIPEVITAAAGNDNVEITGPSVDRLSFTSRFHSLKVVICFSATLDTAETLTITANMQDSADDSTFADYHEAETGDFLPATVVRTAAAPETFNGVAEMDVDIQAAERYIRLQSTADLSRAGTDTVDIAAVFVLGGAQELPAS